LNQNEQISLIHSDNIIPNQNEEISLIHSNHITQHQYQNIQSLIDTVKNLENSTIKLYELIRDLQQRHDLLFQQNEALIQQNDVIIQQNNLIIQQNKNNSTVIQESDSIIEEVSLVVNETLQNLQQNRETFSNVPVDYQIPHQIFERNLNDISEEIDAYRLDRDGYRLNNARDFVNDLVNKSNSLNKNANRYYENLVLNRIQEFQEFENDY
jgi:hypothetical protein